VSRARWIALVAVAAVLAASVVGCGSSQKGADVRKIAFVAPFKDNEPDWTLLGKEVVDEFPQKLHVRVDTADASQTHDVRGVLQQVSHEHNQLVIADNGTYADAAQAVARETKVPELVWGEGAGGEAKGLIAHITVRDKESGWVMGVLSSHAAYSRRLGIVVGADGSDWELATWNRMAGGFIAGAHSVDPKSSFQYAQVGSHGDATPDAMYKAAKAQLTHGAQMLIILGGSSMVGAQRALESRRGAGETLFMGAVSEKASTRHLEEGGVPFMLGSIVWDIRSVFRRAVADVRAGTFGEHPYPLTLANRGLTLYVTGRAPSDATADAVAEGPKVERGSVRVPVTSTSEAVQALIAREEGSKG
jgi:basic membrane lipoprotein Med (substrate-binding protein (PBP1-ABC) superfamily)